MYDIPMAGTHAGDALALMLLIAPILSALVGYLQRPSFRAFFLAVTLGFAVLAAGTGYAVTVAPGKGTWWFAGGLAAWGVLLTLIATGFTVGARALGMPKVEAAEAAADKAIASGEEA